MGGERRRGARGGTNRHIETRRKVGPWHRRWQMRGRARGNACEHSITVGNGWLGMEISQVKCLLVSLCAKTATNVLGRNIVKFGSDCQDGIPRNLSESWAGEGAGELDGGSRRAGGLVVGVVVHEGSTELGWVRGDLEH